ncbi:hypothetical protein AAFG13_37370 [Bradyrhizobium sp. B124]|uniref:hypothetical protein n=1 Tax=Bradyrhizobium sp. B124 TaxID=3140245 RepID=UPI003182D54C
MLSTYSNKLIEDGRQRLVRHGQFPKRQIMTGINPEAVRRPLVRDRFGEGMGRDALSPFTTPWPSTGSISARRKRWTNAFFMTETRRLRKTPQVHSFDRLRPESFFRSGRRSRDRRAQGCQGWPHLRHRKAWP